MAKKDEESSITGQSISYQSKEHFAPPDSSQGWPSKKLNASIDKAR